MSSTPTLTLPGSGHSHWGSSAIDSHAKSVSRPVKAQKLLSQTVQVPGSHWCMVLASYSKQHDSLSALYDSLSQTSYSQNILVM